MLSLIMEIISRWGFSVLELISIALVVILIMTNKQSKLSESLNWRNRVSFQGAFFDSFVACFFLSGLSCHVTSTIFSNNGIVFIFALMFSALYMLYCLDKLRSRGALAFQHESMKESKTQEVVMVKIKKRILFAIVLFVIGIIIVLVSMVLLYFINLSKRVCFILMPIAIVLPMLCIIIATAYFWLTEAIDLPTVSKTKGKYNGVWERLDRIDEQIASLTKKLDEHIAESNKGSKSVSTLTDITFQNSRQETTHLSNHQARSRTLE